MPPTKKTPQAKKTLVAAHNRLMKRLGASLEDAAPSTLGHGNAVTIVCACANTSPLNLARTFKQLGVNGNAFQGCVFRSVTRLGFEIDQDDIPDSPDTTLSEVVDVIEDAPAQEQS
jgi:hypothetical protein